MVESEVSALPDLSGLSILLVDDDVSILRALTRILESAGAKVTAVSGLREAHLVLEERKPHAVLADLKLKDGCGLDLLPDYQRINPEGGFYLLTGHASVDSAVAAFKQGVRDYFEKPMDPLQLLQRLHTDFRSLRGRLDLATRLARYLRFQDEAMVDALMDVPRFAQSDEPVLIQGETGTGKELVARALHGLGPRAAGPFVAINCGAIPETMLEAELFGYEKGAFTGATRTHRGRFEQAHKGTLFLDEIGEMSPSSQVSLLRVLEQRAVQRIGGECETPVDVRIVAATHQPLEERVTAGLFRRDLLYRLDVLPLRLPALRERPKDIPLLAASFLDNCLRSMGWQGVMPVLNDEALALLQSYDWPGNVRELRNIISRLSVRLPAGIREIGPKLLRPLLPARCAERHPQHAEGVFIPAGTSLADAEWLLIDAALKESGYNRAKAAKLLGIGERTLRRKLNKS